METVVLVVHLLLALGITGLVLLQRSEGGALGIGGGGGGGGLVSSRSAANFLTRTTAILAALFIVTSITLSILSGNDNTVGRSLLDEAATAPAADNDMNDHDMNDGTGDATDHGADAGDAGPPAGPTVPVGQ